MNSPQPLVPPRREAPWLEPYWEGLRVQELRLPRCSVCGQWEWYPLASGPACPDSFYQWQAVSPGATVFTFTRVERPLLRAVAGPYVVGLVSPDDAPQCRIVTQLMAVAGTLAIGARARLAFAATGDSFFPYYLVEVNS